MMRVAVLATLALSGLLPVPGPALVALGTIIMLGVPHGALDGEIARPLLRPALGWAWFAVFAVPYLGLAAGVLAAWHVAPLATLAGFLAMSVWHFGCEDAGPKPLEAAVRGGLPVAVPTLLHPAATAHLFKTVAMVPLPWPPEWLLLASGAWCLAAAVWASLRVRQHAGAALWEPAGLILLFAALPPLTAFAAYFVCLHAPRHMAALVGDPRAPRVVNGQAAVWRSLPVTALTILIGGALWRLYPGQPAERLLALTIQGLAALTLPHMLLDWWSARAIRAPVAHGPLTSLPGRGTGRLSEA